MSLLFLSVVFSAAQEQIPFKIAGLHRAEGDPNFWVVAGGGQPGKSFRLEGSQDLITWEPASLQATIAPSGFSVVAAKVAEGSGFFRAAEYDQEVLAWREGTETSSSVVQIGKDFVLEQKSVPKSEGFAPNSLGITHIPTGRQIIYTSSTTGVASKIVLQRHYMMSPYITAQFHTYNSEAATTLLDLRSNLTETDWRGNRIYRPYLDTNAPIDFSNSVLLNGTVPQGASSIQASANFLAALQATCELMVTTPIPRMGTTYLTDEESLRVAREGVASYLDTFRPILTSAAGEAVSPGELRVPDALACKAVISIFGETKAHQILSEILEQLRMTQDSRAALTMFIEKANDHIAAAGQPYILSGRFYLHNNDYSLAMTKARLYLGAAEGLNVDARRRGMSDRHDEIREVRRVLNNRLLEDREPMATIIAGVRRDPNGYYTGLRTALRNNAVLQYPAETDPSDK